MKKLLQDGNGHRLASAGAGMLVANFMVALLIDQLQLQLHPNLIVTGTLLLAFMVNKLVSKYFK